MRKNTSTVLEAWERNAPKGKEGDSIWTDGENIFSYRTCLVAPADFLDPIHAPFILNRTKYSTTTTQKQNSLATYITGEGRRVDVDNIPEGASPAKLREAAGVYDEGEG